MYHKSSPHIATFTIDHRQGNPDTPHVTFSSTVSRHGRSHLESSVSCSSSVAPLLSPWPVWAGLWVFNCLLCLGSPRLTSLTVRSVLADGRTGAERHAFAAPRSLSAHRGLPQAPPKLLASHCRRPRCPAVVATRSGPDHSPTSPELCKLTRREYWFMSVRCDGVWPQIALQQFI